MLMTYTKTKWTEATPITVDNMNKIETGIANALDTTTGGAVNGKLTVKGHIQSDGGNFYSNKNGGNKPVIEVFDGDKNGNAVVYSGGALTVLAGGESGSVVVQNTNNTQEDAVVSADQGVVLYANLQKGWENRKTVELTPGGRFRLHNNAIEFSPENSGYARMGFAADTQDVYISNYNNNWFRLKADKTITYAGNKVYTSFDKPTPAEIGALPLSGGTLTGGLSISGYSKTIGMGAGPGDVYITNTSSNKYLQLKDDGTLRYDDKLIYHEGNFNPATKLDAGNFSISKRDLCIYGKRAMVGHATGEGNHLVINYDRDFANGVLIQGLLRTDTIEAGGKLAFSTAGSGGGLNANIHNLTLHTNTGNGQMLTADTHKIYVGNPQTPLAIESNTNPSVKIGANVYELYHTGNKPTANQIGALPLSGGIMNGTLSMEYGGQARRRIASIAGHGGTDLGDNNSKTTIQSNTVPTWWNGSQNRAMLVFDRQDPSDYIVRCGAGLGGAGGYITFTW